MTKPTRLKLAEALETLIAYAEDGEAHDEGALDHDCPICTMLVPAREALASYDRDERREDEEHTLTQVGEDGLEMLTPETAWHDLIEKNDRTSPEEYPEMCLITFDELADYMGHALNTRAQALLSRLEWSASISGMMGCPLCAQKMDDGHLPDCGFVALASERGYQGMGKVEDSGVTSGLTARPQPGTSMGATPSEGGQ